MLDTTRQFALEKLLETDDGPAMHDKHAAYFLEFARRANKHMELPIKQMERFEKEVDNFRAAIEWQIAEQNTEAALHLLNSLGSVRAGPLWRGFFHEMEVWYNKVRTLPNVSDHPASYAGILNFLGRQFRSSENISKTRSYLEEAQELWIKLGSEGESGLADALRNLGEISLYNEDDTSTAQSFIEQSYQLYQKHNDKPGLAWSLLQFGNLAVQHGHFDEAERHYTTSLTRFQDLGHQGGTAFAFGTLGELMRIIGDYDRASQFWEQNLEIFRETNNRPGLPYSLTGLAWASLRKGKHNKAKKLFMEALALSDEHGIKPMVVYSIAGLAGVLGSTGKPQQAAKLFSAVDTLHEEMGKFEPADQKDIDHYLKVARDQLDKSAFKNAWDEGRRMTIEKAMEYALEQLDE